MIPMVCEAIWMPQPTTMAWVHVSLYVASLSLLILSRLSHSSTSSASPRVSCSTPAVLNSIKFMHRAYTLVIWPSHSLSLFICWFQLRLISQQIVFSSHNKPAPAGLISPETNQRNFLLQQLFRKLKDLSGEYTLGWSLRRFFYCILFNFPLIACLIIPEFHWNSFNTIYWVMLSRKHHWVMMD